jgi:hypothetical protein
MKLIVLAFLLLALVFAQSPALLECIEKRCPDQYAKCKAASNCENKLKNCAAKCGEKLNQSCWTLCIGLPGAAANVALCAVNQGCISNASQVDTIGLTLMAAINNLRSE